MPLSHSALTLFYPPSLQSSALVNAVPCMGSAEHTVFAGIEFSGRNVSGGGGASVSAFIVESRLAMVFAICTHSTSSISYRSQARRCDRSRDSGGNLASEILWNAVSLFTWFMAYPNIGSAVLEPWPSSVVRVYAHIVCANPCAHCRGWGVGAINHPSALALWYPFYRQRRSAHCSASAAWRLCPRVPRFA